MLKSNSSVHVNFWHLHRESYRENGITVLSGWHFYSRREQSRSRQYVFPFPSYWEKGITVLTGTQCNYWLGTLLFPSIVIPVPATCFLVPVRTLSPGRNHLIPWGEYSCLGPVSPDRNEENESPSRICSFLTRTVLAGNGILFALFVIPVSKVSPSLIYLIPARDCSR